MCLMAVTRLSTKEGLLPKKMGLILKLMFAADFPALKIRYGYLRG